MDTEKEGRNHWGNNKMQSITKDCPSELAYANSKKLKKALDKTLKRCYDKAIKRKGDFKND